ncbi:hypothetical protein IV38_GL000701 [Lactobacillus selangorensis]|uniref:SprT-like domain-containing protein n=1 Tax=Lactobacillus selangorensis TaxID=81857 RepID=A0A0R2FF61_9LACO|nr:hypothetical protein IV38_GL000701 [Lactobacillus selangorensis]KRN29869.1 hypothetical protein IV40_GL000577 [Lactobacillus selangorensis]
MFFNNRLKTTGGRYHLQDHHIDINPKMYQVFGMPVLVGIIKHELCHYHLHLTGRGYRHRDRDFKQLLKQVGGSRYAPALPTTKAKQPTYLYICTECGQRYTRHRRMNTRRYVCGKCRGKLRQVS